MSDMELYNTKTGEAFFLGDSAISGAMLSETALVRSERLKILLCQNGSSVARRKRKNFVSTLERGVIYWINDRDGRTLYVGQTQQNVRDRLCEHMQISMSPIRWAVRSGVVGEYAFWIHYPGTRGERRQAEIALMKKLKPMWNSFPGKGDSHVSI